MHVWRECLAVRSSVRGSSGAVVLANEMTLNICNHYETRHCRANVFDVNRDGLEAVFTDKKRYGSDVEQSCIIFQFVLVRCVCPFGLETF